MKLEGYVEHIVYRNAENGYSVLNLVTEFLFQRFVVYRNSIDTNAAKTKQ